MTARAQRTGVPRQEGTGPSFGSAPDYDEALIPPIHGGQKGVRE